ncbi:MAG TPA: lipid-A-disaccharide synthase, partial [Bacteroidota bacterium]|nr:lipid-A-disaccharide synthase [Bacteroidota bacterium]
LLEVLDEPQSKEAFRKRYGVIGDDPVVGLFPGSRKQEVERIFPAMIGAARMLYHSEGVQTVVGVAPSLDAGFLRSFLRDDFPVQLVQNVTYDVMKNVDLAIVTSGTATLETGFYQTPMIVVYKTSWITYTIGRFLIRIKNIGLVNIVAGEQVVPELIQNDANPQRIASLAMELLGNPERLREISEKLGVIRKRLGTPGASRRVADAVLAAI